MANNTSNVKNTKFHNSHEAFTEKAFNTPELLPDAYCFILTNLCNLECDFCFQNRKPKKDAMNADDWIEFSKQLPKYARVTMTGGEPFMFKKFDKVFSYVAERFNCNIISNGLLLTEEKIDYLLSFPKFKVLSLSIDNIGNTIRDVNSKQWKNLEKKVKYFTEKRNKTSSDCLLDIKTLILDENAEKLFETYQYMVEKLKVDTHAFQFLKGSPIQNADSMFNFEDIFKKSSAYVYKKFDIIKQQLEKVKEYNIQTRRVSYLHPKITSLTSKSSLPNLDYFNEPTHVKENYFPCKYPWSYVHINSNGALFPCLAVSMGNVKKHSLKKIITGDDFNRFKNIIKEQGSVEACNKCGWLKPKEELL